MKKINPTRYNCSMQTLYAIGYSLIDKCVLHLSTFGEFSPGYNAEYFTLLQTEISNAQNMPGQNNRTGRRLVVKSDLETAKNNGLKKWRTLKSAIKKTWTDKATQEGMIQNAGGNLFAKASNNGNWAIALEMLKNGQAFLQNNNDALMASNSIDGTFKAHYFEKMDLYNTTWTDYRNAGSTNEIESSEKREANNNLYDKITQICADAQIIFLKDPTMQKQFAFTQLVKQAGVGRTAGMVITFTYGLDNLPIPDVDAVSTDLKYAALSDAKGILKINRMTEGEHTFTCSAQGFEDMQVTVTLSAGIKSRFKFTLQKQVNMLKDDIAKAA